MKKLLLFFLALNLIVLLGACGGTQDSGTSNTSSKSQASSAEESTQQSNKTIDTVIESIGNSVTVSEITEKMGVMIGAVSGKGFKANDKSFEIYYFENQDKLNEAKSGTMKFDLGFGEMTRTATVNGNFVLLYEEADSAVINAFKGA